ECQGKQAQKPDHCGAPILEGSDACSLLQKRRSTRLGAPMTALLGLAGEGAGKPKCYNYKLAPVAQLDRVPGYEPGGRGFESCRARQINQRVRSIWSSPFFLALANFWG